MALNRVDRLLVAITGLVEVFRLGGNFMRKLLWFAVVILVQHSLAQSSSPSTISVPVNVIDVQLTGTAAWHTGADHDSGSITLKASRAGKSRMDLQLSKGQHSEVRVNDAREPQTFVFDGSKWKESAVHNSWVDANWFFPAFSAVAMAGERGFVLSSTGANSMRAQFNIAGQKPRTARLIQVLSIADYDFDPATRLPTRMRWVAHPNDDYGVSIPVEVRYSDYRDVNGVTVPFHIERYFNGTLQLEIAISSWSGGILARQSPPCRSKFGSDKDGARADSYCAFRLAGGSRTSAVYDSGIHLPLEFLVNS